MKINGSNPALPAVCATYPAEPLLPISHPPDPHPRQRFSWTRQERPAAGQSKLADLRPGSTHRTNAVYIHSCFCSECLTLKSHAVSGDSAER
jgi:hypothetical protein